MAWYGDVWNAVTDWGGWDEVAQIGAGVLGASSSGSNNQSGWTTLGNMLGSAGAGYLAGSSSGSDYSLSSYQTPEQLATYSALSPMLSSITNAAATGTSPYAIPDTTGLMPTSDWYSSLSSDVMAGVWAPYTDASNQLTESLGYSSGSAQAGASGVLGAAQADFWSDAGTDVGLQAWNMTSPGLSQAWTAQLEGNQSSYDMLSSLLQGSYGQAYAQSDSSFDWGSALMGGMAWNNM